MDRWKWMVLCGLGVWLALTGLSRPALAEDVGEILRAGTKPAAYELGIGPAIGVVRRSNTEFQLSNTLGYHFSGNSSGFAAGFDIDLSFASNLFVLQVGPRVWLDIKPTRYGFYIAPFLRLGYGLEVLSSDLFSVSSHSLNLQFGVKLKLILNNQFMVFFQPMAFDMFLINRFSMRINLVFGGGVIF